MNWTCIRQLGNMYSQIARSPVVECLLLVDILDKQISVPMYLCSSLDVSITIGLPNLIHPLPILQIFHQFLELIFKDRAGHAFVRRNAYTLTTRESQQPEVLSPVQWHALARPGAMLLMAAVA